MLPPTIFLSSGWPIVQLNYAAILSFYSPVLCSLEITEDDADREENEERTKRRRRFVRYDRQRAYASIMSDYLSQESRFDDKQFERQFRITRSLFEYILQNLASEDEYWRDRFDCTKRMKVKPEVKLLACLKVLSFGVSFMAFCDYFQMGESSVREAVSRLARGVTQNKELSQKFLRQMTKSDARNVAKLHKNQHGVNGMAGCLDCMHIHWENCPNSLRGQHVGKEGVPTLVIEASCDYNLFFWHHDFGHAGALNNLNIWDRSKLHESFLDGTFAGMDFGFEIDGKQFTKLYFLVDGIYPELNRFVKTISVPTSFAESKYAVWQEAVRKNIERGFGVFKRKFKIIQHPLRMHYVDDIFYIVKLCICLHNAIVVRRVENGDDPETEDMYDVTMHDNEEIETGEEIHEEVKDDAHNDIVAEDKFFEENQNKLNRNSDAVDLELLEKYKRAQFLGQRL